MVNGQFAVIVQEKGQKPSLAVVGTGATVRTALMVKKLRPEDWEGKITLGDKPAKLNDRVSTGQLIALTPDSAGGAR